MNKLSTLLASVKQQIAFVYAPQTPVMVDLVEAQRLAEQLGASRRVATFDGYVDNEPRIKWTGRALPVGTELYAALTADQHAAGSVEACPEILGAVARGWCAPKNSHKEMDSDLAIAIAQEVERVVRRAKPVAAGELPKLPEPEYRFHYTADQMRAYGQQCADSRPAGGVSYGYMARAKDGHETFFKGDASESVFHAAFWKDAGMQVIPLYAQPAATLAASAAPECDPRMTAPTFSEYEESMRKLIRNLLEENKRLKSSAVQAGAVPVEIVLLSDTVDATHPDHGAGRFFTLDAVRTIDRAAAPNNTEG